MRSATSCDCVGDPPGELITRATATAFSASNARVRADSTAARLITDRGTGPEAAAMAPLRGTPLTGRPPTSDASTRGSTDETAGGSLRAEGSFRGTRSSLPYRPVCGSDPHAGPELRDPQADLRARAPLGLDDEAVVRPERRAHAVVDVAEPDVGAREVGVAVVLAQRLGVHTHAVVLDGDEALARGVLPGGG